MPVQHTNNVCQNRYESFVKLLRHLLGYQIDVVTEFSDCSMSFLPREAYQTLPLSWIQLKKSCFNHSSHVQSDRLVRK